MAARKKTTRKKAARRKAPARRSAGHQPERTRLAVGTLLAMFADYNPRTMKAHDFEALKQSLRDHDCIQEIVVNRRSRARGWPADATPTVVGGHQRIRAAKALDFKTLPVVYVDLDETAEKLLNVQLNRTGGHFEPEGLAELLRGVKAAGADLAASGLSTGELDALLEKSARRAAGEAQGRGRTRQQHECPECGHKWTATD